MILIFKLLSTPLLILGLTLLSRRFGPAVGGLLMGIPLVTGPVSIFTALENGAAFARHAAIGNLVGQVSTCIFCFVYARAAKRFNCWLSMIAGVGAFFLATFVWNLATWAFVAAIGLLLVTLLLLSFLTKPVNMEALAGITPRWDLPARMLVSTGFVFLITLSTRYLGPQLSGLVAPFPVFVLVLAMFTPAGSARGRQSVARRDRRVVFFRRLLYRRGSGAFRPLAVCCLCVGHPIEHGSHRCDLCLHKGPCICRDHSIDWFGCCRTA